jgi:hypothetical protein
MAARLSRDSYKIGATGCMSLPRNRQGALLSGICIIHVSRTKMESRKVLRLAMGGALLFLGCSRNPSVASPTVDDRRLVRDLTATQGEALCKWVTQVAHRALPPDGTEIVCSGQTISFQRGTPRCDGYQGVSDDCVATVGDVKACYPAFFTYVAAHPCDWMNLPTDDDFQRFMDQVPNCARQAACRYADEGEDSLAPSAGAIRMVVESSTPAVAENRLTENVGIDSIGGTFVSLLKAGCELPCMATETFTTGVNRRTWIALDLFRGMAPRSTDNHHLGAYKITGLPRKPRGQVLLEITVTVTTSEIVLHARERSGSNVSITKLARKVMP